MRIFAILLLHAIVIAGPTIFEIDVIYPILSFGFAFVVSNAAFILKPFAKAEDKKEFEDRTSRFSRRSVYFFMYTTLVVLTISTIAWLLSFAIHPIIYFLYLLISSLPQRSELA